MAYVWLTYSDGEYSTRPLPDKKSADFAVTQGHTVVYVEDQVMDAWHVHINQHRVFQNMWRLLDNEHLDKHLKGKLE